MDSHYVGQPFTEYLTVRDTSTPPALVDPTTVVLKFHFEDGTTILTPAVVRDSLGQYHSDVTLPTAGQWRRVWTTTGPGAGIKVGDVVMVDPLAPEIVSLDDVKKHLQIDLDNTTHDAELADFIAALPPGIEQLAGPILPVTRTETHRAGRLIVVRHPPIAEVVSMTGSAALVVADYEVDAEAGLIGHPDGVTAFAVPTTVVYVSGRVPVPAAVNLAARVIVDHWWRSQRGSSTTRRDRREDADVINIPGLGFAIPRYAAQLLAPLNPSTGMH